MGVWLFSFLSFLISCKKDEVQKPVVLNQDQKLTGIWIVDSTIEEDCLFEVLEYSSSHLLDFTKANKMKETKFNRSKAYDVEYLNNSSFLSDINNDQKTDTTRIDFKSENRVYLITEIRLMEI